MNDIQHNIFRKNHNYVVVTADWSGLGFAVRAAQHGHKVIVAYKPKEDDVKQEKKDAYHIQGKGMVDTLTLEDAYAERARMKDWYWIWDSNHNVDYAEKLRKQGFKVFGGSEFQDKLEHDREFGLEFAESVGLHSPPFQECSTWQEGLKFLEANPDTAYVLKPNGGDSSMTTVSTTPEPQNANIELQRFLKSHKPSDFILQERVKGVEVNVEYFVQNGVPVLAQANLECKRRSNYDLGFLTGCMMDTCWVVSLESKLVQKTVGLFREKLLEMKYTGFFDVNVIIGDNTVYFLEFCARFGYNAHPNFFLTLSNRSALATAAMLADGVYVPDYKFGFGASMTIRCEKEQTGLPIYIPESLDEKFYLFDGYCDEEGLCMGGFGEEIGIITAHNYTIETAFDDCLENAKKIKFTGIDYRTDGDKTNYSSSPVRRYEALQSMGLF